MEADVALGLPHPVPPAEGHWQPACPARKLGCFANAKFIDNVTSFAHSVSVGPVVKLVDTPVSKTGAPGGASRFESELGHHTLSFKGSEMASVKENMKALVEQRDRLLTELEALKNKIAGLDMAIAILQQNGPVATGEPARVSRRSGVKGYVLDLLKERGSAGLNAQLAVEIAGRRGVLMDRGSVSSLLSRLKQEDVLHYDGSLYRLKEFAPLSREDATLEAMPFQARIHAEKILGAARASDAPIVAA